MRSSNRHLSKHKFCFRMSLNRAEFCSFLQLDFEEDVLSNSNGPLVYRFPNVLGIQDDCRINDIHYEIIYYHLWLTLHHDHHVLCTVSEYLCK